MKRLITHIKNLFGADEKLRKWCIEQATRTEVGGDPKYVMNRANMFYDFISKGRRES